VGKCSSAKNIIFYQKLLLAKAKTDNLCPNCHAEYHRHLGHKYLKEENKQSMEFYIYKYYKWLSGVGLIVLFLYTYFK